MKKLLFTFLFPAYAVAAIYGRNDLVAVWPNQLDPIAQATAILAPRHFLNKTGPRLLLDLAPLKDYAYVCEENPWKQWASFPVSCTGFLIAPDIMVTAGHCMVNFGDATNTVTPQCEGFDFVFDYRMDLRGQLGGSLPADNVVECEKVIHATHASEPVGTNGQINFGEDFAIVKLKRAVTGRTPLKLSSTPVKPNDPVTIYGHPMGVAMMKGTGKVLSLEQDMYFRSNIDAFPGHSGSPVLNARKEVVGILVRGYPESLIDAPRGNCNVFNTCDNEARSCRLNDPAQVAGEHVQLIKNILPHL